MTLEEGLHLALLVAVALAMGSFVGVLVMRLPAGDPLWDRSVCPNCGVRLGPKDLVPVASWLWLKGRCRRCDAPLGWFYPAVELAAVGVAIWAWTEADGWVLWASCGFGWTLLALGLVDWRHMVLPDLLTLPLIPAGPIVAEFAAPDAVLDDVAGAAGGFVFFTLVAWAYRRWRGWEGLGAGDAKLLAAIGAWVGATGLPSVVLLASLVALVVALGSRAIQRSIPAAQDRVPFGPALAVAAWIVWLYGPLGLR
jgi:leader peptidase (prepilin peptidase) / N-methyltransferase